MFQKIITDSFQTSVPGLIYYGGDGFGYLDQRMGAYADWLDAMTPFARIHSSEWDFEQVDEFQRTLKTLDSYKYKRNKSYRRKGGNK